MYVIVRNLVRCLIFRRDAPNGCSGLVIFSVFFGSRSERSVQPRRIRTEKTFTWGVYNKGGFTVVKDSTGNTFAPCSWPKNYRFITKKRFYLNPQGASDISCDWYWTSMVLWNSEFSWCPYFYINCISISCYHCQFTNTITHNPLPYTFVNDSWQCAAYIHCLAKTLHQPTVLFWHYLSMASDIPQSCLV